MVGDSWPSGSLDSSAMCTIASTPSRSSAVMWRRSLASVNGVGVDTVVQPAGLVEAGVDPDHLVAVADELGSEQAAEVTLGAGDENLHDCFLFVCW